MGYIARNVQSSAAKQSVWASGNQITYQKYDCDSATETTVIKNTIDVTDFDYLHYYYVITDFANTFDLKIKIGGTTVYTDNIGGNGSEYGSIDITAYSGTQAITVTLQRTGGAGTVGVLSHLNFNVKEA